MSPAGGGAGSRRGQDVARPAHRRAQDHSCDDQPDEDGTYRATCREESDRQRDSDLLADCGDDHQ